MVMRAIGGSSCNAMLGLLTCLLVMRQKKNQVMSLIEEKAFEDSILVNRLIWHSQSYNATVISWYFFHLIFHQTVT